MFNATSMLFSASFDLDWDELCNAQHVISPALSCEVTESCGCRSSRKGITILDPSFIYSLTLVPSTTQPRPTPYIGYNSRPFRQLLYSYCSGSFHCSTKTYTNHCPIQFLVYSSFSNSKGLFYCESTSGSSYSS